MDSITFQKATGISNPAIFLPPPYCRKADRKEFSEHNPPYLKLLVSNPSRLLKLYQTLTDRSSKALEVKFNNYLMQETESKSVFLLHLLRPTEEAFVQTIESKELEKELRFPLSKDAIAQVIHCEPMCFKCEENLKCDISKVFKDMFKGARCKVVAVPILPKQKHYACSVTKMVPLFLTCFVDSPKNEDYLIKEAHELFRYCLPVLTNVMEAENERRLNQMHHTLLTVIHRLFANLDDIYTLINIIIEETRRITNSKKCNLYLKDPKHVNLICKTFKNLSKEKAEVNVKATKAHDIPDQVATTGTLVTVNQPCSHSMCEKEKLDFEIRNMLCFPIKNGNKAVGAVRLYNKKGGNFNHFDEQVVHNLEIFFGTSVMYSLKCMASKMDSVKNQVSDGLMLSNAQVTDDEVKKRVGCAFLHKHAEFSNFEFSPRRIILMETECYVLKMCDELGFFTKFPITKLIFTKFIGYVKQCCHDVPYHNWVHLFSTAHFAYLCLKNLKLVENGYMSNLEALAYFLSCLCHDIDYRGTNNPFQQVSHCVIASLYSSAGSTRERYSLSQILRILNIEGCNFLDGFDSDTYSLIIHLMKDFILATDLATHFKFYEKQYNMIKDGYNKNNPEHRYLFTTLMVTCADLSDHAKDWSVVKETALAMYTELVVPHTMAKEEAARIVAASLEKVFLPDLQVDFIEHVSLPAFRLLAFLFKPLANLVHQIKKNIIYWECSKHLFEKGAAEGKANIDVLKGEQFDEDIENTLRVLSEPPKEEEKAPSVQTAESAEEADDD